MSTNKHPHHGSRDTAASRMASAMGLALFLATASAGASVAATIDTPVIAGVDVVQTIERYTVSGVTGTRVLEEMQARAPRDPTGGRLNFGHTWAELSWSYDSDRHTGGECAIGAVRVNLEITIKLPDWQPEHKPDRALAAQWQAFSEALTRHELQHRAFAIGAAEAIRDVLQQMPRLPCDEVDARNRKATAAIMREMSEANRDYDMRTLHGRSEGAYWRAR